MLPVKSTLIPAALIATAGLCCTTLAPPAQAASTDALVDMCVAAMDAQSVAKADEYRAKLKKIRGGGLKRLTLDLTPITEAGEKMVVECRVRGGKVVDLIVK